MISKPQEWALGGIVCEMPWTVSRIRDIPVICFPQKFRKIDIGPRYDLKAFIEFSLINIWLRFSWCRWNIRKRRSRILTSNWCLPGAQVAPMLWIHLRLWTDLHRPLQSWRMTHNIARTGLRDMSCCEFALAFVVCRTHQNWVDSSLFCEYLCVYWHVAILGQNIEQIQFNADSSHRGLKMLHGCKISICPPFSSSHEVEEIDWLPRIRFDAPYLLGFPWQCSGSEQHREAFVVPHHPREHRGEGSWSISLTAAPGPMDPWPVWGRQTTFKQSKSIRGEMLLQVLMLSFCLDLD